MNVERDGVEYAHVSVEKAKNEHVVVVPVLCSLIAK
jgi:hypothetical protein